LEHFGNNPVCPTTCKGNAMDVPTAAVFERREFHFFPIFTAGTTVHVQQWRRLAYAAHSPEKKYEERVGSEPETAGSQSAEREVNP